jgi:predicted small secreted protein
MRSIIFALLTLFFLSMNIACNTVRGFGRDVERVGEGTQNTADSVRRRL